MLNFNDKLEIFERFEIDRNLPKYKEGVDVDLTPTVGSFSFQSSPNSGFQSFGNTIAGGTLSGNVIISTGTATGFNNMISVDASYLAQLGKKIKTEWPILLWFKKKKEELKQVKAEKKRSMTIIEFFSSLATSLNDLKTLTDIAVHYETAITNALKAGQIALADQLKLRLNSAKSEAQLVTYGLNKYLSEEQVVAFYKKADKDKNLKLTWIKNFIKPIPSKILDLKGKLDGTFVFDNYVILHYDPNNDATNLTAKEQEDLKKDPILFGVIDKSRRLYYVGDWIDEYCNLTLDVVMETLGDVVSEINNDTVKTFIDRGFQKDVRVRKEVEKILEPNQVDPERVIIKEPIMIREDQSKEKIKKRRK